MITSIDREKYILKNPTPLYDKTLNQVGIEGNFLHIIEAIYAIPTALITLNGMRLKAFSLN